MRTVCAHHAVLPTATHIIDGRTDTGCHIAQRASRFEPRMFTLALAFGTRIDPQQRQRRAPDARRYSIPSFI